MSEYPRIGQREPVSHWLPAHRSLLLQIESKLRERVATGITLFGRYLLVSTGKHDRLKNNPVDLIDVLNRKTNDIPEPIAVPALVYRDLKCSSHSGCSDVL